MKLLKSTALTVTVQEHAGHKLQRNAKFRKSFFHLIFLMNIHNYAHHANVIMTH